MKLIRLLPVGFTVFPLERAALVKDQSQTVPESHCWIPDLEHQGRKGSQMDAILTPNNNAVRGKIHNGKTHGNSHLVFNPSNAKATFIQSTVMQRILKIILTLSCWYSLDSSRRVLLDEYPFARNSVIF